MWEIVAFEWRYHARQISFLAAAILFFIFGFALTAAEFGASNTYINSPYSIMQSIGLLSLAAIFIVTVFCANAVVRDREYRMEEIVFTTAVEKSHYLFGRFIGSFVAAFTAFSTCALGMLAATYLTKHDPSRVGPLTLGAYARALLVMALPNLLFAAALLFAVATMTRSVLASSVAAVFLYVLYFIVAALTNSPLMAASVPGGQSVQSAAVMLDPFGLSAFFAQTRYWTPAIRNVRLVALSGDFLWNRVLCVGLAMIVLAVVYRLFSFRVISGKRAKAEPIKETTSPVVYVPARIADSQWAALRSALRIELRSLFKSVPFLLLMLLWAGLAGSEIISTISSGEYGAALYPTTGIVFSDLQRPLYIIGIIVLIYYSTEIIWRERTVRFAPIVDATPASNAAFVLSKAGALAAIVAALLVIETIVAAVLRVQLDPSLIAQFAWYDGVPLLLFAVAAIFFHSLTPNKHVGMFLLILFFVARDLWLEHPLWRFGLLPPVSFSAMNGFTGAAAFDWLTLHWTFAAALLLLITTALWRKGGRERINRPLAITLSALFAVSCVWVFYNTNILNSRDDAEERAAEYEKKYNQLAALPQPRLVDVKTEVAIEPAGRRYTARGRYIVLNDTPAPIDMIVVTAMNATITIPNAALLQRNPRFGHYAFHLDPPLMPQGRTEVQFDLDVVNRGFTDRRVDNSVTPNGSFIMSRRSFPTIGYSRRNELNDPVARRKFGLPPRPEIDESDLGDEAQPWIAFDATVSTSPDQIAITSGRLEREWSAGNHRYFHYKSESLIPNDFSFASAHYAVARAPRITVYYHPAHSANVSRIIHAAQGSLKYFDESFGPYPHSELKIAEVPAQWPFGGFAQPGTIFLGENRAFLIDARDPRRLDLVSRRVAHEVGHQWWGLYVAPAPIPGALAITESLAKYSELAILERLHGSGAVRESLTRELDMYLAGRANARRAEVPLDRCGPDAYLYYRKGAIVMHAIKDLLGEAAMNRASHDFVSEQGGPGHRPTTAQLLQHFYAIAPQHRAQIDEWMKQIVIDDNRVDAARATRLANGKYEVAVEVTAAKADKLDLGIFSAADEPLYVAKCELHGGKNVVTVTVDKKPLTAVIDPYVCRIDANRFDNEKRIAVSP
jgi:ABC-type transport system involved in multi-copper enzyme maturation permease subunit